MVKIRVAIIGLGTVGTGVAKLLLEQSERVARHTGCELELAHVVVNDIDKPRDVELPRGVLTDDLSRVINDTDVKLVAQLVGGIDSAYAIMQQLLESAKDVVTANKALIAEHGKSLFETARRCGRTIAFEASVAGGIPIIANLGQCLSANQVTSLRGILNGTSNFIVSQMEEFGADYAAAVAEAQQLGYAEADPTMDVDGTDAAQKLAILAHLTFGADVNWRDIPCRGIDQLTLADMQYARELGYRIKLLAIAQLTDMGLELHVSPTLVRIGQPLAEVRGPNNAISVVGDAVGRVFFLGPGAGQMPTASAVVADLIDTAVGRTRLTFDRLNLWSEHKSLVSLGEHANVVGRFYLRFSVDDRPGVLADIAGALGRQQISIASMIQHEPPATGSPVVPLVIMTHEATEGAVADAMQEIDRLDRVHRDSVSLHVLD